MNSANQDIISELRSLIDDDQKVAFISGDFNVVHPGHLRLFDFTADFADVLIIGLNPQDHKFAILPDDVRLSSFEKLSGISKAFVLQTSAAEFIADYQPDFVVKGKEHEERFNTESLVVESYGGKLMFSSGDFHFSSLELLRKELEERRHQKFEHPQGYLERHKFSITDLANAVDQFKNLKVVVVGDLIIDEYVTCDALGMSQEDPTLVVSPMKYDRFLGGAGIVAAHARGFGAKVSYFGVCGKDQTAEYAREKLSSYGVEHYLQEDDSRPTSLKQRFRATNKTLLRVSHLRSHDMSAALVEELYDRMLADLTDAHLLVFSDFNYGCLPQTLVDRVTAYCIENDIMMVADSQASSQVSDISRFKNMTLITPTEREARLALQDPRSGLVVIADSLQDVAKAKNVVVTLGAEGVLVHSRQDDVEGISTDRLPAFNSTPKDVAGGGDSFLTGTAMALACGVDIWRSTYLGSIVAACQVSTIGNRPIQASDVLEECNL